MLEFNIVPVAGGWFEFPETVKDCSIYQPLDYPSEIIVETEACCIKVEEYEILFECDQKPWKALSRHL